MFYCGKTNQALFYLYLTLDHSNTLHYHCYLRSTTCGTIVGSTKTSVTDFFQK